MEHSKTLVAALAIALLGFAPQAFSQEVDVPWMSTGTQIFSVHAGGQMFDLGSQLDNVGTDVNTTWNVGGRYQVNLNENLGLEAGVSFSPSDFDFVGPGIGSRGVDALYYTGNLVYNILPTADVIPYLTGGAGAVTLFVDNDADDTNSTRFVGNFGGGFLFPIAERFGFRFEVRDYIYRLDDLDQEFGRELTFPANFDETVNDLSITGGISVLF